MRPPEPEFLTEWKKLYAAMPKCCHNCENYSALGECIIFFECPPPEFIESSGKCENWLREIPF